MVVIQRLNSQGKFYNFQEFMWSMGAHEVQELIPGSPIQGTGLCTCAFSGWKAERSQVNEIRFSSWYSQMGGEDITSHHISWGHCGEEPFEMPGPSAAGGSYAAFASNSNSFFILAWGKSLRQEKQACGTHCIFGWEPVLFNSEFSALWAHLPW